MPSSLTLQVGCPTGCQGSNLSVLPVFSPPYFSSCPWLLSQLTLTRLTTDKTVLCLHITDSLANNQFYF